MNKPSEILHDLSLQLDAAYRTALEVSTMLETLRDAHSEEVSGHMCALILERNGTVSEVLDVSARKLSDLTQA